MAKLANAMEYADEIFKGIVQQAEMIRGSLFTECEFIRCNFQETRFTGCRFADCVFRECNLSLVDVTDCSFTSTRFIDSQLSGVDWTRALWQKKGLLNSLDFERCTLNYGLFFGLSLTGLKAVDCGAKGADFSEADLSGAILSHSDLLDARFNGANLTGADLTSARNYQIDARVTVIKKARFSLPEAISLLQSMEIVLDEEPGTRQK